MAKQIYRFSGKAAYITRQGRQFKPEEPMVWTMLFYPATAADRAAVRGTGIKNGVKEDDGSKSGVEGLYFTFRATAEYAILDKNGDPIPSDVRVANGATVEIELEVETFNSAKHGPQARSKLLAVHLQEWQPYAPATETEAKTDELPA